MKACAAATDQESSDARAITTQSNERSADSLLRVARGAGRRGHPWGRRTGLEPGQGAGTQRPAPKLREVVEFPEDYVGQTFTYTVKISPKLNWLQRNGRGNYFLYVLDSEGSLLPHRLGGGTLNSLILPAAEARKLIVRLSAAETYEAQIRFSVEREQVAGTSGYYYIARVHSVELP